METKIFVSGSYVVCNEVHDFLSRVGQGGSWQYFCDFGTDGVEDIEWFKVGSHVDVPVDWNAVYYPVYPVKNRMTGKKRGGIRNVDVVTHLFSEFDVKDGATLEMIENLPVKPSIIIFSGGGWHCYWLLREPVKVNDENVEYLKQVLYGWVDFTGGDGHAKDLARVLRVPTSFNNKPQYGEPKQVVFMKCDLSLEYSFDELASNLSVTVDETVEKGVKSKKVQGLLVSDDPSLYPKVVAAMAAISETRVNDYAKWVEVGMALWAGFEGNETGLIFWDTWSQKCSKYVKGECASKWKSFDSERVDKITLKRIFDLAQEDSNGTFIKPAPKDAKPSDYMEVVHTLGYQFTQNSMNDRIYVNGNLMSDGIESLIMTKLREHGYRQKNVFEDAFIAEGHEKQFHPIREYLGALEWDGKDHLGELGKYVKDKDDMFPTLIRKWFIGAVSKILAPSSKEQNPMLVLAGAQGKGKSVMVHWFGSPLPEFFIASPIYPDNKDFVINSSSHFVWEVEELGSTLRRQDIEALKAFLSRPTNSFRAPYGRFEIQKPVTASYIGTINPDGNGFLNDNTGNRRYRVCHIIDIDWGYEKALDINQLWAQAVALFKGGETYLLDAETDKKIQEINDRYSLDDPLAKHILDGFEIVEDADAFVSTADIMRWLKANDIIHSEVDKSISMRLGNIMVKLGAEKITKRVDGVQARGWSRVKKY